MGKEAPEGGGPQLDPLRVRTFPDRIIVDLTEDPFDTDYVAFDEDGAYITLSAQRVRLGWPELLHLAALIGFADQVFEQRRRED